MCFCPVANVLKRHFKFYAFWQALHVAREMFCLKIHKICMLIVISTLKYFEIIIIRLHFNLVSKCQLVVHHLKSALNWNIKNIYLLHYYFLHMQNKCFEANMQQKCLWKIYIPALFNFFSFSLLTKLSLGCWVIYEPARNSQHLLAATYIKNKCFFFQL